jgi:hypothetical protein
MSDAINHPAHYKAANGMEAIDVIEGFGLGFHLGNVVKYVLRAGRKDPTAQDLRKADWYLRRRIAGLEAATGKEPNDLRRFSLCYLATPYSKYKGGDLALAFQDAAALAASLLIEGIKVYSPIAHTHPLAVFSHLDPLDHSIWLPFDEAMMEAADALIVAHMDGWEESFGIAHEIKKFVADGKPIFDLDPATLQLTKRGESA